MSTFLNDQSIFYYLLRISCRSLGYNLYRDCLEFWWKSLTRISSGSIYSYVHIVSVVKATLSVVDAENYVCFERFSSNWPTSLVFVESRIAYGTNRITFGAGRCAAGTIMKIFRFWKWYCRLLLIFILQGDVDFHTGRWYFYSGWEVLQCRAIFALSLRHNFLCHKRLRG